MQPSEAREAVILSASREVPPLLPVPASWKHRFATMFLDGMLMYAAAFVYFFMLTLVLAAAFGVDSLPRKDPFQALMTLGIFAVYYLAQESLWGRTLGKLVTGTKVIQMTGGKPGFGSILVRTLCRFIPFEAATFLNRDASGWHDTLSGTRVVLVKPSPPLPVPPQGHIPAACYKPSPPPT